MWMWHVRGTADPAERPELMEFTCRIIAFSIACGMRVKEIRAMFIEMTPSLRSGSESQLYSQLERLIPAPAQSMEFEGVSIEDSPLAVNIWVPAEADVAKTPGIWYAFWCFIIFS
jgi:hypothetical protein